MLRVSIAADGLGTPYPDSTADPAHIYLTETAYAADVRAAFYQAFFPDWSPTAAPGGFPVVSVLRPVSYRVVLSLAIQFPDSQTAAGFAADASGVAAAVAAAQGLCPSTASGAPLALTAAVTSSGSVALLPLAALPFAPASQAQFYQTCLQSLTAPDATPQPRLLTALLAAAAAASAPASAAANATGCFLVSGPIVEAVYDVVIDAQTLGASARDVAAQVTQDAMDFYLEPALVANYLSSPQATLLVRGGMGG